MIKIEFSSFDFQVKKEGNIEHILDKVRRKWVRLTPEEWVRQNILHYLNDVLGYPSSVMAVEKEIKVGDMRKRCDVVVYSKEIPWMIVECKEMNVGLSDKVLQQVLEYNIRLKVAYILITNGLENYLWKVRNGLLEEMEIFPMFGEWDL